MDRKLAVNRRPFLIGAALSLPIVGAVADFARKAGQDAPSVTRHAMQIHARAAADPQHERQLPVEKLWQGAAQAKEDQQD